MNEARYPAGRHIRHHGIMIDASFRKDGTDRSRYKLADGSLAPYWSAGQ